MSATVVTFYSFKGGVGRTQALANVAVGLANRRKNVVIVDMDLESPGLHAFFHPPDRPHTPYNDSDFETTPGVLDFAEECLRLPDDEPRVIEHLVACTHQNHKPGTGWIRLFPAGRLSDDYAARVGAFSWESFYKERHGYAYFELLRDKLVNETGADYVLIDSRTGLNDVANIGTVQLPDTVVVLFALHEQGVEGAYHVSEGIRRLREDDSARARARRVLLVPSRVEESGNVVVRDEWLLRIRRRLSGSGELLSDFNQRIPYAAEFAYGEQIVVDPSESNRLSIAYERLLGEILAPEQAQARKTQPPSPKVLFADLRVELNQLELNVRAWVGELKDLALATVPLIELPARTQDILRRRAGFIEAARKIRAYLDVLEAESEPAERREAAIELESTDTPLRWISFVEELRRSADEQIRLWIEARRRDLEATLISVAGSDRLLIDATLAELMPWLEAGDRSEIEQRLPGIIDRLRRQGFDALLAEDRLERERLAGSRPDVAAQDVWLDERLESLISEGLVVPSAPSALHNLLRLRAPTLMAPKRLHWSAYDALCARTSDAGDEARQVFRTIGLAMWSALWRQLFDGAEPPETYLTLVGLEARRNLESVVTSLPVEVEPLVDVIEAGLLSQWRSEAGRRLCRALVENCREDAALRLVLRRAASSGDAPADLRLKLFAAWLRSDLSKSDPDVLYGLGDALVEKNRDPEAFYALEASRALGLLSEPAYAPVDLAIVLRCIAEGRAKIVGMLLGYKDLRDAIFDTKPGAALAVLLLWQPLRFPWDRLLEVRPKVPQEVAALLNEPLRFDVGVAAAAQTIVDEIRASYFNNSFHAHWGSAERFEGEFHALIRARLEALLSSEAPHEQELELQECHWSDADSWIESVMERHKGMKKPPDGPAKRSVLSAFEGAHGLFTRLASLRPAGGTPSLARMLDEASKVPRRRTELLSWLMTGGKTRPVIKHLCGKLKTIVESMSQALPSTVDAQDETRAIGRFPVVPGLFHDGMHLFDLDDPARIEPRRYLDTLLAFCVGDRSLADAIGDYIDRGDLIRAARCILELDGPRDALRGRLSSAWGKVRAGREERFARAQQEAERLREVGLSWPSSSDLDESLREISICLGELPGGAGGPLQPPDPDNLARRFARLDPGLIRRLEDALEIAEIALDEGRDALRRKQQETLEQLRVIKKDVDRLLDELFMKIDLSPEEGDALQAVQARAGDCVRRRDQDGLRGLLEILRGIERGEVSQASSLLIEDASRGRPSYSVSAATRGTAALRRFSRHDISALAKKSLGETTSGQKVTPVAPPPVERRSFEPHLWSVSALEEQRDYARQALRSSTEGQTADAWLGEYLMAEGKLRLLDDKPFQASAFFLDALRWTLSAVDADRVARDMAAASLLVATRIAYSCPDERAEQRDPMKLATALQRGALPYLIPALSRHKWLGELARLAAQMGERDGALFLELYVWPHLETHPRAAHGFIDSALSDLGDGLDGSGLLSPLLSLVASTLDRFFTGPPISQDSLFRPLLADAAKLRERTQHSGLRDVLLRLRGLILPYIDRSDVAAFAADRLEDEARRLAGPLGRPYALSHALLTPVLTLRSDVPARCVLQISLPAEAPTLRNLQIEAEITDDHRAEGALKGPAILPRLSAKEAREIALPIERYDLLREATLRVRYRSLSLDGIDRAVETRTSQFSVHLEQARRRPEQPSNPYVVGTSVQSRDRIYGRDGDLQNVWTSLVGEHQDNAVIITGERRIGKSTLLNAIQQEPRFRNRYLIVKDSLEVSRHEDSFATLIRSRLVDRIRSQLKDAEIDPPTIHESRMQESPATEFEAFMRDVDAALKARDRRFLIILDELDYLLENTTLGALTLAVLRSVILACSRVAFVFAGATEILHRYTATRKDRFFQLAIEIKLQPLDEVSARRLLHDPVKDRYDFAESATEVVLRETSRQPYLLQRVGHVIFQQLTRTDACVVTRTDVDEILDKDIVPHPEVFYDFIKSVPDPVDFLVIQGIAALQFGNRYVSVTNLRRELGRIGRDILEEDLAARLHQLTESAPLVVERRLTTRQYRLKVGLFARHLRHLQRDDGSGG